VIHDGHFSFVLRFELAISNSFLSTISFHQTI
jgi:hypothetical protein